MSARSANTATSCSIHLEPEPSESDRETILAGLRAHNRLHAPSPGWTPLNLLLRDAGGKVCGGLLGESGWEWLHIHILWVAEAERRRGYGGELLARSEAEARRRGCRGVHLDTHEYQAPDFYRRRGYEVFGVLDDYPRGSRRYFMAKALRTGSSEASPEGSET